MPIRIKNYTWTQTDREVLINVPLRGVSSKKADVYCSDLYVKVNYAPYLFELDLIDLIDYKSSTASIGGGYVTFRLVKKVQRLWNRVSIQDDDNDSQETRAHIEERRQDSCKRYEADHQAKLAEMMTNENIWTERQLKAEEGERKRIEERKEQERVEAIENIKEWKSDQRKDKTRHGNVELDRAPSLQIPIRAHSKLTVKFTKFTPANITPNCLETNSLPMRTKLQ